MSRFRIRIPMHPLVLLLVLFLAGLLMVGGLAACSVAESGEADDPGATPAPAAEEEAAEGATEEEVSATEEAEVGAAEEADSARVRRTSGNGDGPDPYDEVVTEDAVTSRGLFHTHQVDEDLFFEIPDSVMDREILMVVRPTSSPGLGDFYRGGRGRVVSWSRRGEQVVLRALSYEATADTARTIWREVRELRDGPVVAVMDVEAIGPDSATVVVDATSLFTTSNALMSAMEGVDRNRTWIEGARAYPRNVEVDATQTGRNLAGLGSNGGGNDIPVSLGMHWSFMLLPDRPMKPRLHDRRVGFNSTALLDFGRPEHRAESRRYIRRFRLEPSDTAAFRRGELVDPVKPIVFWIDPATPEWLQPWVVTGVNAWEPVFREAGFANAIEGRMMPADDPDFDLHDARYSVIYWRPSTVENATGGGVIDPRTGEILKAEVNMYHDVQNLVRNWYFTQVAPLDSRVQSVPMPDSLMGRLVEYVVTHEVGHAVGFPHNMKASAMYPPDSLRSESFLRRMGGHVATLMDYSRFNYVAQPEDSIPPELLIPRTGPYDEFAVEWGYRPILDAETPDDERPVLDEWARAQDSIPWLRFTTSDAPNDPRALTEAVGDADAVQSSTLGLLNLQRVLDMLLSVAERPGEDYELLDELYGEAVDQWSRYMGHVAAVVGGADTRELYGQGERFFPLDRPEQEEAVAFLTERALRTPEMLIRGDVLRRIEAAGVVDRIREAQSDVLETLLSASRLTRLVEYEALADGDYEPYPLPDLMEDVREAVWTELASSPVEVDIYRRNLQRSYLDVVEERLTPEENGSGLGGNRIDPTETDIRPVLRGELRTIRGMAEEGAADAANAMTRLHLEDVVLEIDRILEGD